MDSRNIKLSKIFYYTKLKFLLWAVVFLNFGATGYNHILSPHSFTLTNQKQKLITITTLTDYARVIPLLRKILKFQR